MLEKDDVIGDYKLEKFLGRGQFGEVWLAEKKLQFSTKKVRHALKFLFNTGDEIDLKAAEAEIDTWIEASGHPNVMSVIDMLLHKDSIIIVSEFAEGGSILGWLKKYGGKAPSIEKGLEMMTGILRGIEHLHSKNVVHRDLKPDNILLQGNFPRITDFGISRIISSGSMSTKAMGSPMYMSPESFNGNKSPQNDIWSAGVILYEMLTGTTPFLAENIYGLVYAIQSGEIKPLPQWVSPELREIVETALQKDRERRFQTAKEMRLAIEQTLYQLKSKESKFTDKPKDGANLTLTDRQLDFGQFNPEFEKKNITQKSTIEVTQNNEQLEQKRLHSETENLNQSVGGIGEQREVIRRKKQYLMIGGLGVGFFILVLLALIISPIFRSLPITMVTNSTQPNLLNKPSKTSENAVTTPNKTPTAPLGMVYISGGELNMGRQDGKSEAEKPVHQVSVLPFFMDVNETTKEQYAEFVKATHHPPPTDWKNGTYPLEEANFPVVGVNWEDANEYAKWSKKRLPTEAEWEFAARGTGNFLFPWGNDWQAGKANVGSHSFSEVGKFKGVSPFGVYDMVGNAWEWTASDFKPYPNGKLPESFEGKTNLKTIRGGSFEATKDFATTTYRIGWGAKDAPNYNRTGFRCVKDLD